MPGGLLLLFGPSEEGGMSRRKQSNPRQFRRSIHRSAAGREGEHQDEQQEVGEEVEDRHRSGSEESDGSTGFRVEEPTSEGGLKCDDTADTLLVLQPHLLSHLFQPGPTCQHRHLTLQTPRNPSKHRELHRHGGPDTKNQPELSKSSGTGSPKQDGDDPGVLDSPVCHTVVQERGGREERTVKGEANSGNQRVKSEPSSPRVASSPSPGQRSPTSPFHMPPLIPQGINMVPQASEVLAQMSKLVHRRLRNGGNGFPPLIYLPKGASCFERNVTFSNVDNYLVHKKHHCNAPWQHMDESAGLIPDLTPFTTSPFDPFKASAKRPEGFPALVKKPVDSSGVEERPKDMTVGPKMPSETSENEADPSQTTCQACKITFGRQENYAVHKRYYCASRHDPPAKRATTRTSGNQKPGRARKRRQMRGPDPSVQSVAPNSLESLEDQLRQQYNTVSRYRETSLMVSASRKSNAAEQEGVDVPVDLSKKCSKHALNLTDYHKCSVCKISFYKVEDYLSHKLNFCPSDHKARRTKTDGSGNVKTTDIETSTNEQPFLRDDGSPWKKTRPDDQIWPYYEISPADHASEVPVTQSPKEGSEGANVQPMPNLKVEDKQERGRSTSQRKPVEL